MRLFFLQAAKKGDGKGIEAVFARCRFFYEKFQAVKDQALGSDRAPLRGRVRRQPLRLLCLALLRHRHHAGRRGAYHRDLGDGRS